MDILDEIAVEVPCSACGGRYEVTLRQIMLSERMMRRGCPVPGQYTTECPPQYYADLAGRELIEALRRNGWRFSTCISEQAR